MPTWNITSPVIGVQPITERSTTQRHELGFTVQAKDATVGNAEFMYVKGVASGEYQEWATFDLHGSALVRLAANAKGTVGVLQATLTASYYGWIQVKGICTAQCLTQFADNGKVFATATAGAVDDASVAGDLVSGAVGRALTAVDSGVSTFELDHPFMTDADS